MSHVILTIPHGWSPRFEAVESRGRFHDHMEADFQAFSQKCVAAISPGPEKEEREIHPEKYLKLLQKYEDILKPNFSEAKTKHGIEHSIITSGPPCKAKARPLLPGSPKAIEGKKAWMELVWLWRRSSRGPRCPSARPCTSSPSPVEATGPAGTFAF